MKKLLSFMLLISLNAIAQTSDVHQLDQEMKNFRNRVHIYAKCLTGKCTTEERNAAAKAALKDGAIVAGTVALVGVTIGASIGGRWFYLKKQKEEIFRQLSLRSGNGGIGSILNAVQDAMKVAFQVDQNKKLMVRASSQATGPTIHIQEEFPSMECQTEVNYTIADHSTNITLKRCGNEIVVTVHRVGTLTPLGTEVLLTDLYKEAFKVMLSFLERLKLYHDIAKIIIQVPLIDEQGTKIIKDIEI